MNRHPTITLSIVLTAVVLAAACSRPVNDWGFYKTDVTSCPSPDDSAAALRTAYAMDRAAYGALHSTPHALIYDTRGNDDAVREACDAYAKAAGDTIPGQFTVTVRRHLSTADIDRPMTRTVASYTFDNTKQRK